MKWVILSTLVNCYCKECEIHSLKLDALKLISFRHFLSPSVSDGIRTLSLRIMSQVFFHCVTGALPELCNLPCYGGKKFYYTYPWNNLYLNQNSWSRGILETNLKL